MTIYNIYQIIGARVSANDFLKYVISNVDIVKKRVKTFVETFAETFVFTFDNLDNLCDGDNDEMCTFMTDLCNDIRFDDELIETITKSISSEIELDIKQFTHDTGTNDFVIGIQINNIEVKKYKKGMENNTEGIDIEKLINKINIVKKVLPQFNIFNKNNIKLYNVQNDCRCCS